MRPKPASGGFELPRLALALVRIEEALADPDRLWSDFDQLIVLDVSDRLLEAHALWRSESNAFVLAGCAEVGELLGLQRIDLEVLSLRILADDHALVEHLARRDEEDSA